MLGFVFRVRDSKWKFFGVSYSLVCLVRFAKLVRKIVKMCTCLHYPMPLHNSGGGGGGAGGGSVYPVIHGPGKQPIAPTIHGVTLSLSTLEAHGCKPSVTNFPITLGILTANITYCTGTYNTT